MSDEWGGGTDQSEERQVLLQKKGYHVKAWSGAPARVVQRSAPVVVHDVNVPAVCDHVLNDFELGAATGHVQDGLRELVAGGHVPASGLELLDRVQVRVSHSGQEGRVIVVVIFLGCFPKNSCYYLERLARRETYFLKKLLAEIRSQL